MFYNAPAKGDDGLYFVKALGDDKRKCFVQLNNVKVADVSGEVVFDLGSEGNVLKIQGIDSANLESAKENCETWFGKKLCDTVIKRAYTPSVTNGQITGDRIEATKVFNAQQEVVEFDMLQTDKMCNVILEFAGLWFAKKTFGPTWNLVQVKIHPDPEPEPILDVYPDGYAFVDDDDQ
tara:strand:- start:1091 stop:1624 length:534 start_codon:yes stop_codon:yes gene_type:complete